MQLNRAHNVNGDGVLYHTLARATRVSRDLRICIADKTPPFRDHCRCYAWVSNRAVGDSTLSVLHLRFDSRFRDRSAANLWRVLSPVLASQPLFLGSLDRSVQR